MNDVMFSHNGETQTSCVTPAARVNTGQILMSATVKFQTEQQSRPTDIVKNMFSIKPADQSYTRSLYCLDALMGLLESGFTNFSFRLSRKGK